MIMYIDPLLIWMLTEELNCLTNDVAANLHMYHTQCIACPPNQLRGVTGKLPFDCWILRGFYPRTDIMFKMVTTYSKDQGYFIKASLPDARHVGGMIQFSKKEMEKISNDILLDSTSQDSALKTPRCITPKGMKPLKRSNNG